MRMPSHRSQNTEQPMLSHRSSRSQSVRSLWTTRLALSLCLAIPGQAWADRQSAEELATLNSMAEGMAAARQEHVERVEPENRTLRRTPFEKLAKTESLSPAAKACWMLVEDRMNTVLNKQAEKDNFTIPPPWYPFAGTKQNPAPTEEWLMRCSELPGKFETDMQAVLDDSCKGLEQTQICQDLKKRWIAGQRPPLPKSRKIAGGLLIGVGAASIILGVLHLSFPLFKVPADSSLGRCEPSALQLPCVAGRFELGLPLIGIGAAAAVVGGLTVGIVH